MNTLQFDLRDIDDFNTLELEKKKNILLKFNLNRYKFVLDQLKVFYDVIEDKKYLKEKIENIFNEGCLNFYIITSNFFL